jgi:hypothetical protein
MFKIQVDNDSSFPLLRMPVQLRRYIDRLVGWVSVPGRDKIFLFSIASTLALGPTQAPIQWVL